MARTYEDLAIYCCMFTHNELFHKRALERRFYPWRLYVPQKEMCFILQSWRISLSLQKKLPEHIYHFMAVRSALIFPCSPILVLGGSRPYLRQKTPYRLGRGGLGPLRELGV